MANGPLRTFFRQDAGMPDDEPDLTDFLLESMLKRAPAMRGGIPSSTAPTRMVSARGPQEHQVNVGASGYPPMPSSPPRSAPMPAMQQQTWADIIPQLLAGAGDVVSARGGQRTNYLQQAMGAQQGLRNQAFQQAMMQRSAMDQAEKLAHEYEWRRYAAGQQESRQDFSEKMKQREADLYDKMLGKEKEKGERFRNLLASTLPQEFAGAEDAESLNAMAAKALRETQGDPDLMAEVRRAQQIQLAQIIRQQQPGAAQKGLQRLSAAILPPTNPLSLFAPAKEWDFDPSNFPRNWVENWYGSQAWDRQSVPSPSQRFNPYPIPR